MKKIDDLLKYIDELHSRIDYNDYLNLHNAVTEIKVALDFKPSDDLADWVTRNWEVTIYEDIKNMLDKTSKGEFNILDVVDRDDLAFEISEKILEGILNVINSYEE